MWYHWAMAFSVEEQLVVESKIVPDDHLANVAAKISKWDVGLAFTLGLTQQEVIEIRNSSNDYASQKQECLLKWKRHAYEGEKSCTYGNLVKALKKWNENDACRFISELLKCPSRSQKAQPNLESSDHSDQVEFVSKEASIQPLNARAHRDMEFKLHNKWFNIRKLFSSYVRFVRLSLEEKNVDFHDLRSFILSWPAFIDAKTKPKQDVMLWSGDRVDFKEAKSINDIFEILVSDCCSCLDCRIFEHIMNEYQIDCTNTKVVQYKEALKEFVKEHEVSEFSSINPSLRNLTKDNSSDIHLKFDVDEMTCRLGDIVELQEAVARILGLDPAALVIHDIKEGCIELTLLIPTLVAKILFNDDTSFSAEQVKQFRDISLIWLKCGECMFNFKQEESTSSVQPDPDFKQAVTTLNQFNKSTQEFLTLREETLNCLDALKKGIETSYNKSRKAMVAGSATAIGGSVLGIVGFVLTPITFGASLGLGIVGGTVATAGAVTMAGAEIGYTAVSKKKLKKVKKSYAKDTEMMKQMQDSGKKVEELVSVLAERYDITPDRMFHLFHHDTSKIFLSGLVHTGRLTKTATSTARAVLAGSRTAWATMKPVIRTFGVVSAAIDIVFIPVDVGVLIKSSYDVHKHRKGKSNSVAAKEVQKLIDNLTTQRDKLIEACDEQTQAV